MQGAHIASALAVYFIIWWITLFTILPWGIRSQIETGEIVSGTEPGAPSKVRGWRIVIINTIVSFVIFFPLYFYWDAIADFLLNI